MEHQLRTWPEHYAAIERGAKTCELRLNDRPYAVGDTLLLREFEPMEPAYTGRELRVRVTHILNGGAWLSPGYIAMSIHVLPPARQRISLGACPRCGSELDNLSPGISVIAGGLSICTSCLSPGETEIAHARGIL